jgi:hypothetical protein
MHKARKFGVRSACAVRCMLCMACCASDPSACCLIFFLLSETCSLSPGSAFATSRCGNRSHRRKRHDGVDAKLQVTKAASTELLGSDAASSSRSVSGCSDAVQLVCRVTPGHLNRSEPGGCQCQPELASLSGKAHPRASPRPATDRPGHSPLPTEGRALHWCGGGACQYPLVLPRLAGH